MTKVMTSPKHPNWTIEKSGNFYYMQHKDFKGYMIEVFEVKGQWFGQILTQQKVEGLPGQTEWSEAQVNPMCAPVEEVKVEVIRRGTYWNSR